MASALRAALARPRYMRTNLWYGFDVNQRFSELLKYVIDVANTARSS